MTGAMPTAQISIEILYRHPGDMSVHSPRIHLSVGRRKNGDIVPHLLKPVNVIIQHPWIPREVFARRELGRVDENRNRQIIAMPQPFTNELNVARVQRSHRRNEHLAPPSPPTALDERPHFACGVYNVHNKDAPNTRSDFRPPAETSPPPSPSPSLFTFFNTLSSARAYNTPHPPLHIDADMSEFRTEKDSMGDVQVPAEALYGAQTQRAADNFPISELRFPRRFIEALGVVKQAAAHANRELDLLDRKKADAIIESTQAVIDGALDNQFILDVFQTGSGTSTNMNANEVIANLASEKLGGNRGSKLVHPNDDVNMSQSSNDVIPTAMHVAARVSIERELIPALTRLHESLGAKAKEFDDVLKSGRTHLMDATPVRLGQEFGGYASQIHHAVRRLRNASNEVSELALGGTAVGTGVNRPVDFPEKAIARIGDITGLAFREAEDHFEAQAAKDAYVNTSGALNTLAVSLMKIANDLRHLSSGPTSGLSEIRLPSLQPGSSIMPGKVNPVLCEAVMMMAARVMGNHTTVTVCGQHGNFELNVMMPIMAHAVLESISILANGCDAFREKCVDGIEVDRERCRELLELNPSIATALNAAVGYDQASKVAKKAAAERKSVRDVVLEMGLVGDHELDRILDVRNMTEPGIPGE